MQKMTDLFKKLQDDIRDDFDAEAYAWINKAFGGLAGNASKELDGEWSRKRVDELLDILYDNRHRFDGVNGKVDARGYDLAKKDVAIEIWREHLELPGNDEQSVIKAAKTRYLDRTGA
jgi:hypothetical protein